MWPSRLASARRIRTQAEWNVETHITRARLPTSAATRSFISPAALLVKVIARTWPGLHVARRQQIGDAVGQHPGLARAGPGDDQQGRALVHDGRALLRVEPLEQGVGVEPTDDLGRGLRPVRYVAGRTVNRSVEQGAHRPASLGLPGDRPVRLPACTRGAGQAKAR